MTHESPESLMLVLCRGAGSSRVVVDLESFLMFNSQMDQDLQNLVDRWSDFSTPASVRENQVEFSDR
jgi:hypothetical protein